MIRLLTLLGVLFASPVGAQYVSDPFTGADDTALTAHTTETTWAGTFGANQTMYLTGNRIGYIDGAGWAQAYVSAVSVTADYDIQADIVPDTPSAGFACVTGRTSTTEETFYQACYWASNLTWYLSKVIVGTTTHLVTYAAAISGKTTLKLEMRGSTIKMFVAGIERGSVTDTSITAIGRAGLRYAFDNSVDIENFLASDPNPVMGGPAVSGVSRSMMGFGGSSSSGVTQFGPTSTITCPGGAVSVSPGSSIQTAIDGNADGTSFCLEVGTHVITASLTPKTGNTFTGAYGATLDGTGWSSADSTHAAFQASNSDINNVTIRNLVIRNMPQKGIYANSYDANNYADNWLIEYNEITGCLRSIVAPNTSSVRNNKIHNNADSGYGMFRGNNTLFEDNEFSYNGRESKILISTNITFRRNWVHHQELGIWYDTSNTGSLVEDNLIEDNEEEGIDYEIGFAGTIRNNIVRRNGLSGIILISSQDLEVYGNTVQDNFRGISLLMNCGSLVDGFDLQNNDIYDNVTRVPSVPAASYAVVLSFVGGCSQTPYLDLSKNNTYTNNDYTAPDTTSNWFFWGGNMNFATWQALPQDATGSIAINP